MRLPFIHQNNFFLFLIIFLFPLKTTFGQARIYGTALDYKNDSLAFYFSPDPITHRQIYMGNGTIDSSGNFDINISIHEAGPVYADLGAYRVYLFIEPGKTYKISLPPKKPKTIEDYLNPFFFPQQIHLGIPDAGEKDLNYKINQFDLYFNPYLNYLARHVYANRLDTSNLNKFLNKTDTLFGGNSGSLYFKEYVQYKMALLLSLRYSRTSPAKNLQFFPAKKVLYNNPAYTELFNRVFNRILKYLAEKVDARDFKMAIRNHDAYPEFQKLYRELLPFRNDSLAELILLKGIYDECFETDFRKEDLLGLLDNLVAHTQIELHKKIAANIKWKVTRLDRGQPAPFFRLKDQFENFISPKVYRGKYIYLNFASFKSYACRIQFPLLKTLYQKYNHKLEIITISVDASREEMLQNLNEETYPWPFLFLENNNDLLKTYDIRGYPTYFLLDREGRIIQAPAPSPTEEFENYFRNIIQ